VAKNSQISFDLSSKIKNRPKELKKGQKLQIWPQKKPNWQPCNRLKQWCGGLRVP